MSAVMLLPGTNGSLVFVQRTVTRIIVLQETIGKDKDDPELQKSWLFSRLCCSKSGTTGMQHLYHSCFWVATGTKARIVHLRISHMTDPIEDVRIPLDNCQPIRVLDPGDSLTPTSAIVKDRLDFADSIVGKGSPSQTTCYVQSQDPDNPVQQILFCILSILVLYFYEIPECMSKAGAHTQALATLYEFSTAKPHPVTLGLVLRTLK
ncbi:hypothetical protein STEG23_022649, partial [Scotinomys teguina]